MMRLAVVMVAAAGALVAGCGGGGGGDDDAAAGSTAGAQACVKRFNADHEARVLASQVAPGEGEQPPAHGRLDYPARMASTEQDGCVLLVGPDPVAMQPIKSVSGRPTWTSYERSISPKAKQLEAAARESDDVVEGTVTSVEVLHARSDPQAGRFAAKR